MSDNLHPIIDIVIELLSPDKSGTMTLKTSDRNTLLEVLEDVSPKHLPNALFALVEFAQMLETNHQSPIAAKQIIQVAAIYTEKLESIGEGTEALQREKLAQGNKFLAFSERTSRQDLPAPKTQALSLRDCVQQWRGVIAV